jgi:hypothetical protein
VDLSLRGQTSRNLFGFANGFCRGVVVATAIRRHTHTHAGSVPCLARFLVEEIQVISCHMNFYGGRCVSDVYRIIYKVYMPDYVPRGMHV